MIKYLISTFLFLSSYNTIFAQQSDINQPVLDKFKAYFNKQETDSIYQQWSEGAKVYVSKAKLDSLLQVQLYPLGTIESTELLATEENLSYYKLNFTSDTLKLALSTDTNQKIETFFLQPYDTVNTNTAKADTQSSADTTNAIRETQSAENDLDNFIDSLALRYTANPNSSGLGIAVSNNGKTSYYYYGETTHGNKQLPGHETLFEIESISKTITATLLAHQALTKKINLDDSITNYLPDSVAQNPDLAGITFRNLATHTSGLPYLPDNLAPKEPLDPYRDYTRALLFSYLKNYKRHIKPDSLYEYSNLGYGLIGDLLSYSQNTSYHEMVQRFIAQPLGLHQFSEFPESDKLSNFAPTYNKEGQLTPHWHFLALSAAGSLKSSLPDLMKFAEANLNPPKTTLGEAIRLTQRPAWLVSETQDLGLAWHISIDDFQEIYWHNGATYGSSSYLAFIPKKKVAIVILANSALPVDDMGYAIVKKLIAVSH